MKTGAELIAEERQRQVIGIGWTAEYDAQHKHAELAAAGAWYADAAVVQVRQIPGQLTDDLDEIKFNTLEFWPWDEVWCKPSPDPIRNLVKAGALIAAEIDRLQREQMVMAGTLLTQRPVASRPNGPTRVYA